MKDVTDRQIYSAAVAVQAELMRQNNMLEIIEREGDVLVYDEYDNKTYDCKAIAGAVLRFSAADAKIIKAAEELAQSVELIHSDWLIDEIASALAAYRAVVSERDT